MSSTVPAYHEFKPLPWQYNVIHDVFKGYDYSVGPQYLLFSGAVGSAKSLLGAFLACNHATTFNDTTVVLGRLSLPDLKKTLFSDVHEMLAGTYQEGRDYTVNRTSAEIRLRNGTQIIGRTWIDKRFEAKFRSLRISMFIGEEAIESKGDYWNYFNEVVGRLGRVPHVKQNLCVLMTNPDEPSHPIYDFFQNKCLHRYKGYWTNHKDRHIYYSSIKDNPYLPEFYEASLRDKYDPQMAQRMLDGKWLYIGRDKCYYSYDPSIHITDKLEINKQLDLRLCFDFNIAKDKPMSSCIMQFDRNSRDTNDFNRRFKILDEVCVEGMRTLNAMEVWADKGYFDLPHNPRITVHGDAAGNHRHTSALRTDYEIIQHFLTNYQRKDNNKLNVRLRVQRRNPVLRERHNSVNSQLKNAEGTVRVSIDKRCKNVCEGLSSTRLKDGVNYIEDPATKGQDMATALSYGIWYCVRYELQEIKVVI